MQTLRKYAKMTDRGAVVTLARSKKEAAEKLNTEIKNVYLYK